MYSNEGPHLSQSPWNLCMHVMYIEWIFRMNLAVVFSSCTLNLSINN